MTRFDECFDGKPVPLWYIDVAELMDSSTCGRTLVCGGRSSGKSTLVRHMVRARREEAARSGNDLQVMVLRSEVVSDLERQYGVLAPRWLDKLDDDALTTMERVLCLASDVLLVLDGVLPELHAHRGAVHAWKPLVRLFELQRKYRDSLTVIMTTTYVKDVPRSWHGAFDIVAVAARGRHFGSLCRFVRESRFQKMTDALEPYEFVVYQEDGSTSNVHFTAVRDACA